MLIEIDVIVVGRSFCFPNSSVSNFIEILQSYRPRFVTKPNECQCHMLTQQSSVHAQHSNSVLINFNKFQVLMSIYLVDQIETKSNLKFEVRKLVMHTMHK